MRSLLLIGKTDCHLCRELRRVAEGVASSLGLGLEERDVTEDPELERLYLFEIPVLLFGDAEVARHRTTPEELRSRLAQLLGPRI